MAFYNILRDKYQLMESRRDLDSNYSSYLKVLKVNVEVRYFTGMLLSWAITVSLSREKQCPTRRQAYKSCLREETARVGQVYNQQLLTIKKL